MSLDTLLQDVKYGARSLLKTPGLTIAAVLALALGLGANAAIFSFVDALLLHPFSFETEGLVVAVETVPGVDRAEIAAGRFLAWRQRARSFDSLEGAAFWEVNLTGAKDAERVLGYQVTPGLFGALKTPPRLGRAFAPDEDQPGKSHVVILSHDLWQRRFAGDSGAVGKSLIIDGQSYEIVGVMEDGFRFPKGGLLWAPLVFTAEDRASRAGNHSLTAVGRLKPGVSADGAVREIKQLDKALRAEHPGEDPGHLADGFSLRDYGDTMTRMMLWVLMAAVILVQLIACANVGNMLLARGAGREREIAVRAALGASRGRLLRQLLIESLLLSLCACGLGMLFASWGITLIQLPMPAEVARWISGWTRVGLDFRVLAFGIVLSMMTAVIAGLLPALKSSRPDLHRALQGESSGATSGGERKRARAALVALETALALVLAVCAGLMVKSLVTMLRSPLGFESAGVLSMKVAPAEVTYKTDAQLNRYFDEALQRLRALPGVTSAAAGAHLPQGQSSSHRIYTFEGQRPLPAEERLSAYENWIAGDYLQTLRIPLLAGRAFGPADDAPGAPLVALISERLARRHFDGKEPIGARVRLGARQDEPWRTVVGVVGDVKQSEIRLDNTPVVYVPNAQQTSRSMMLVVRSTVPPASLGPAVRAALRALDPDQPVGDLKPFTTLVREQTIGYEYGAGLMTAFAGIALLLGGIGIGGVVAYSVRRRSREMGIRLALGATPAGIVRLSIKDGMRPALIGLGVGLLSAAATSQALTAMLYRVAPLDPATFALAAVFLAAVALAACWLPARRAASADPLDSLKTE